MNKVITCMLLAALTVLPAGCSVIFKTPQVSLKQTEIKKVDRDGVDIECRLAISNQNPFDLSMLSYRYDLKLAARPFASGSSVEKLIIPSGKETVMTLPARIKFDDFIEVVKAQPDLGRIPYQLNATLKMDTPVGTVDVPVEKEDTFAVPEKYRPDYYIKKLRNLFSLSRD